MIKARIWIILGVIMLLLLTLAVSIQDYFKTTDKALSEVGILIE